MRVEKRNEFEDLMLFLVKVSFNINLMELSSKPSTKRESYMGKATR